MNKQLNFKLSLLVLLSLLLFSCNNSVLELGHTVAPTLNNKAFSSTSPQISPRVQPANKQELINLITSAIADNPNANLNYIDTSLITDMSGVFRDKYTFNGDISKWNTSKVTTMNNMFHNATNFNQPIGNWDVSQVTTMNAMFYNATNFNQDIGKWDVSKVEIMSIMFENASSFNQDITSWDVSRVRSMFWMFHGASAFRHDLRDWKEHLHIYVSLTSIFVSSDRRLSNINWDRRVRPANKQELINLITPAIANNPNVNLNYIDTSLITDMSKLFMNSLFNGDISRWDTSKVTDMHQMFYVALEFNQDISSWNTSKVTDMSSMFNTALVFNQDVSGWDTSQVTNMTSMFASARKFNQPLNNWNTANVIKMAAMFYNARVFAQDISRWNTSKATDMYQMFDGAYLFNQDIDDWDTSKVTNMRRMFDNTSFKPANKQELIDLITPAIADNPNVNLNYIDTSLITDMSGLFMNSLFNGDISKWDTSQVTDMHQMFYLTPAFNQDIGGWNTSQVTNMSNMFDKASVFNQDIGGWNTSQVTDMSLMFREAFAFNQDISGWNTSQVINMWAMFYKAKEFNQDISGWDVSKVLYVNNMFQDATAFKQDLSSWEELLKTSNKKNMFDSNEMVPSNWNRKERLYKVKFIMALGQEALSTTLVSEGEKVANFPEPVPPSYLQDYGYSFGGWYKDRNLFTNQFTTNNIVTSDLSIYAKWDREVQPANKQKEVDPTSILFSWEKIDYGSNVYATEYTIYIKTMDGSEHVRVGKSPTNYFRFGVSANLMRLSYGKNYHWYVTGKNKRHMRSTPYKVFSTKPLR